MDNPAYFSVGDGWITHVIANRCYKQFTLSATAPAPAVQVLYNPAPRSMVNLATEFRADRDLMPGDYVWSGTVDDFDPDAWHSTDAPWRKEVKAGGGCPFPRTTVQKRHHYQDFRIAVRLQRVGPDAEIDDPPPCWVRWDWDEREWGEPKSTCSDAGSGPVAAHTWLTSSFGRPANGMSLSGVADLPAYQVGVETYWVPQARWEWEHWECTEWQECTYETEHDCNCEGEGPERHCDTCEEKHTDRVCAQVGVVREHREFMPDLRDPEWCGLDHMYLAGHTVRTPDGRVLTALPVPVIEVQGVIQAP
jgi:hypothetical protein